MSGLERGCRLVAIQAALVVAAVHLLWAIPRLLRGEIADPRPVVFVVAALLLVAVAAALFRGYYYRRLSTLGGGTLAALLVGFPLFHRGDTVAVLTTDPLAAIAVGVALIGTVAFVGLYYFHHPDRFGLGVPEDALDQ